MKPEDKPHLKKVLIEALTKEGIKDISPDELRIHEVLSMGDLGSHNIYGFVKVKGTDWSFSAQLGGGGEQMKVNSIRVPEIK